jgi:hypothetical protein
LGEEDSDTVKKRVVDVLNYGSNPGLWLI